MAVDVSKVSPTKGVRSGLTKSYRLPSGVFAPYRPGALQTYEDPYTNNPKQITDGMSVDIVPHAWIRSHFFSRSTLPFVFSTSSEFMWVMASTRVGAKR